MKAITLTTTAAVAMTANVFDHDAVVYMAMTVMGAVFVVILLPLINKSKRFDYRQQIAYIASAFIFGYIVFRLGNTPPALGWELLDAIIAVVWGFQPDIRCFIVGMMMPNIIDIITTVLQKVNKLKEKR